MWHICLNCGEHNSLGDCCPSCCARECDRCDELVALDTDIAPSDIHGDDAYEFKDGSNFICEHCLTPAEKTLYDKLY